MLCLTVDSGNDAELVNHQVSELLKDNQSSLYVKICAVAKVFRYVYWLAEFDWLLSSPPGLQVSQVVA